MRNADTLILFTRFPVAGEVKTRLIPALGAEGAADLHRRMTEFALAQALQTGAAVEVRYTGGSREQMRDWLGRGVRYAEQGPGTLGERMSRAFAEHFGAGVRRVVLAGSDCPSNRRGNMTACFRLLETRDCVIGPAADGGYYMIGLSRPAPELFQNIDWGTGQVLRQTLAACRTRPRLTEELRDVDLVEDVPPRISVIIPALNEAGQIQATLERVWRGFDVECVVADGGSEDGTGRLARGAGAQVVRSGRGRALQMNAGAAAATGELLLFLHADTRLPDDWDLSVRAILKDPRVALGAFRFRVSERMKGIGLVEWGANLRSRCLSLPYGDQGLFMTRGTFRKLAGFPEMPILEDLHMVRAAGKLGEIRIARDPVLTSGRRWQRMGIVRTTLRNQRILFGWLAGTPFSDLLAMYKN
jgi:hypothetical protein